MKNRELIKELLNYSLDAEVALEIKSPNNTDYMYSDANSVCCKWDENHVVISEKNLAKENEYDGMLQNL